MIPSTQTDWPSSYATFKRALALMGRHAWPVFMLLLTHLLWVVLMITAILVTSGIDDTGEIIINYAPGVIFLLLFFIYTVVLFIATARLAGEQLIVHFRTLFNKRTWQLFFPVAVTLSLLALIVSVGSLFLIVPGIVFLTYFSLAPFFLVLGHFSIVESFKQSYSHVKGMGWNMFQRILFLFLLVAMSRLFAVIPGPGQGTSFFLSLILAVVTIFYLAVVYYQVTAVQSKKSSDLQIATSSKILTVISAILILAFFWAVTSIADFVSAIYPYPFSGISLF